MQGVIHSFQSLGTLDGPGLRTVIFMQGCPLRCINCHNPETWPLEGSSYDIQDVYLKIMRYENYIRNNGGVTVSGGEPLLQWEFVAALFSKLRESGIHTALDTSGIGDLNGAKEILKYTNLVICDLKFSSRKAYLTNCKADIDQVFRFLKETEKNKIPLWIRHLIIPGITDTDASIKKIIQLSSNYMNVEKLEFLPFKKSCIHQYENLGIPFPLERTDECANAFIEKLNNISLFPSA